MKPPATEHRTEAPRRGVYSVEERRGLAVTVSRLLESWDLSATDRAMLLGLAEDNRAALARYARGEAIAANRDTLDRVGHLLGIHKSLVILYPRNPEIQRTWMTYLHPRFGNLAPIDVVRRYGMAGLLMVRGTLDALRGR